MKFIQKKIKKKLLDYNPETGIFIWKYARSNRIKVGSKAGSKANDRYRD